MHSAKLTLSFLLLLLILPANSAFAQDAQDDDEYEETARVMRVSLLRGEVGLRRAGNNEWESARLNLPLVEGDTISTGADARIEIQVDRFSFVRVGPDSMLSIITLRDDGIALSLSEGTATVRLARFDRDREYFEVDAPKTTMAAEKTGSYRVDARTPDRGVRITVRGGGQARIYSETSGFTLRDNRSARLIFDGDEAGDWELSAAPGFDEWDNWTDERERHLATRLRGEGRDLYYDRNVWGAEELDAYGDWSHTKDYGWVWRPHITIINIYDNWAPYRYGHWRWCPPYGWTWVGDEEWGWAPYHYGRWVHYNDRWCWAPRGYGYPYRRSWWRPALVAFVYVDTSRDRHIAWYPLQYGQRDPHSRSWKQRSLQIPARSSETAKLKPAPPAPYLQVVSAVTAGEFGSTRTPARPAPPEVARRAITGEPISGSVPVAPPNLGPRTHVDSSERARLNTGRPAPIGSAPNSSAPYGSVSPARSLPERSTGATVRTPGVPLDNELRRVRVYGGRDPRPPSPGVQETATDQNSRNTGAVMRPGRLPRSSVTERRSEVNAGNEAQTGPRRERPLRPRVSDENSSTTDAPSGTRRRERRPVDRSREEGDNPGSIERRTEPARPPQTVDRPVPPPIFERREDPVRRPERPAQPATREERPERSIRPQQPESPRENAPPRAERPEPRREQSPPPPPPRQEPPAQPAPAPPERSEPPASPRSAESPGKRMKSPAEPYE